MEITKQSKKIIVSLEEGETLELKREQKENFKIMKKGENLFLEGISEQQIENWKIEQEQVKLMKQYQKENKERF